MRTANGWTIFNDKPLPYSTLLLWIKMLGQITGFMQVTRPYSLRYAGGKAFNNNDKPSLSRRNNMLDYYSI